MNYTQLSINKNDTNWSEVQIFTNLQRSSPRNTTKKAQPLSQKLDSSVTHKQSQIQTEKHNKMQSSNNCSQGTASSFNNFSHQKQENLLKQLEKKYLSDQKSLYSHLQVLKNLPRIIHRNSNIKIECKTEFPLVRAVAVNQFGWGTMSRQNHKQLVDIIWTDTYVTQELVNRLRPYQKVNHFPYSTQMGRKDQLFINLNKMRSRFEDQYNFYAKTWIFPQDYNKFKKDTQIQGQQDQNQFYIAKPVASCQGKGIHLGKRSDMLYHNSQNKLLVQQYLKNTLLIDGLKFDLRVYVLIKSFEPLIIYVYQQGLTRLATNKYQKPDENNYKDGRMHLTNYAINKNNPQFVHNKDFKKDNVGHKRSLGSFYEEVQKMGGNSSQLKQKINSIIIKTILSVYEKMTYLERVNQRKLQVKTPAKNVSIVDACDDGFFSKEQKNIKNSPEKSQNIGIKTQNSNKCFQLLGFDIMIEQDFEPKLIQINHQPSLSASSPLDYIIKKCLLIDVFNLLDISSQHKEAYLNNQRDLDCISLNKHLQLKGAKKQITSLYKSQKESQNGGFNLIYPLQNQQIMNHYHQLMPILLLTEQSNQNVKKIQSQFSQKNSKQTLERLSLRENKTSLGRKRKQYTCNYINMFTNGTYIGNPSEKQTLQNPQTLPPHLNFHSNSPNILQPPQFNFFSIKATQQKIHANKLAEYNMAKKNLNFTIKYKRNHRSNNKSIEETEPNTITDENTQKNQIQGQQKSKGTGFTFYNAKIKFTNLKIPSTSRQNTITDIVNTQPRHTSHENRIGIKMIKQTNQFERIEINSRKFQYRLNNNKIICLDNSSGSKKQIKQQVEVNSSSIGSKLFQNQSPKKGIGKRSEYLDRMYQKELMSRICKMKTMRQKLQRLKRNYAKKQQEGSFSKDHIRGNKLLIMDKQVQAQQCPQEQQSAKRNRQNIKSVENRRVIKDTSGQKQRSYKPYQTIKFLQFTESTKRKPIYPLNNQSSNGNQVPYNSSLELFKDSALHQRGKHILK